jgi:RNA polymerase sigma-70 factor (ECF subfamily)
MDADDIIQDFSLRVVRSASSLLEREKLRPWLSRVLWSAFIDHLREQRAHRHAESAGRVIAAAQCGSEVAPSDRDAAVHICMRAALRQLKPEYAATIERIDFASETAEQVAATRGETANNIRVRLFRARRALRARLVQQCRACPGAIRLDCTYASNIAEQRANKDAASHSRSR